VKEIERILFTHHLGSGNMDKSLSLYNFYLDKQQPRNQAKKYQWKFNFLEKIQKTTKYAWVNVVGV
jgi:hypothetical protein